MRSLLSFRPHVAALSAALAATGVVFAACGTAGDDIPASTTPSPDAPQSPAIEPTSAPGTPVAYPTDAPPSAAQLAYAAALKHFDAVAWDKCEIAKNPEMKNCVMVTRDPASPDHGIATFAIGSPGGGGVLSVFGRTPEGTWKLWFATQNVMFRRVSLPGDVRVCAGGDRLNVRAEASSDAAVVTQLAADAVVNVSDFVLTEPFEQGATKQGAGWYRLADGMGWVYSRYLSDATLKDCTAHDAIEGA